MSINFDKILSGPLQSTLLMASSPTNAIFDGYTIKYMGKSNTEGKGEYDVFDIRKEPEAYKVRILPRAYRGDPREAFDSVEIKKWGVGENWHSMRTITEASGIPYKKFYKSDFIHNLLKSSTPSEKGYLDYTVEYMGKSNTEGMREYYEFDVRNRTEAYKIRILPSALRGDPSDLHSRAHIKKLGEGELWHSFTHRAPIGQLHLDGPGAGGPGAGGPGAGGPGLGSASSSGASSGAAGCGHFAFSSTGRLSYSMEKYVPSINKQYLGFDDPFLDHVGSSQLGQGYSYAFSVDKKFLNDNPLIFLAGIPGNNPEDQYLRWFLEGPVDPARIDLSRKILVDIRCGNILYLKKERPISDELWHAINAESTRRRSAGTNPNPWADPKPRRFEGGLYKQKYLKYKQKYLALSARMNKF
jgi:hypothetical protein